MTESNELTRPIIGIENRSAQEVFDIMCDRIRHALALRTPSDGVTDEMVERAARAIDPDAFSDYERRYSYEIAQSGNEADAREFADYYDTRPDAMKKARAALSILASPGKE